MKKRLLIVTIILAIIALIYRRFKSSNSDVPNLIAFSRIIKQYGPDAARKIEQIQRLETAHYTSDQWLATKTAGMQAFSQLFPYGWASLQEYCDNGFASPENFSIIAMKENATGQLKNYIVFDKKAGANGFTMFQADLLFSIRNGDYLSWHALPLPQNILRRDKYEKALKGIKTPIVDSLLKPNLL